MTDSMPRERILRAAAHLLHEGGRDAVTTRAVSAEAHVQPQTIYRQFGDMPGLLDAVASRGFSQFLEAKTSHESDPDPVEQLRQGWDLHIEFAVDNPAIYMLMYGERRSSTPSDGTRQVYGVLHAIVAEAAAAGRLAVPVDDATAMIYATGIGVALTLIADHHSGAVSPESLSHNTREAVLGSLTIRDTSDIDRTPIANAAHHAVALQSLKPVYSERFTHAERALFSQWLDAIARQ